MRQPTRFPNRRSAQSGVVLFVALILLLILSLIGVTAARLQTVEERMARNENNHQLAEQAAEAALRPPRAVCSAASTRISQPTPTACTR
jgi:type IV pilus assembly protein PilX